MDFKTKFSNILKLSFEKVKSNKLFIFTTLILLLKSILFLGIVASKGASSINMSEAFFNTNDYSVYIFFIIPFVAIYFLFKGSAKAWYLVILNLVFSILVTFDLWYYRGFASFLSPYLLKTTTNLDGLSGDIMSMSRPIDILFFIDIAVILFFLFRIKGAYKKKARRPLAFVILLILSVSFISLIHYKDDELEKGANKIVFRICWTPNQTMANLAPIGYHLYDTYTYFQENSTLKLSDANKKEISDWFKENQENLPDNKYKGMFKGKNLIYIQVESLENFVLNQKVDGQEITPNINKLLKNSLYFSDYHEEVYNGTSSDSDLMSNTSVYPVRTGSTFFRFPSNTYNSMPKLLEQEGYNTLALHPDKGSYWNWMPALKSIGFQQTFDTASFKQDEFIGLGLSDGTFLSQVAQILAKQKTPFYSFMVTLTSHGPFDLPKKYRELKLTNDLDKSKLGGYFQAIHYTDKQIGLFMDSLKANNLLDNSVIVLYGDHTGVHKYYDDEIQELTPHESWWDNNNKRIPLIVYQDKLQQPEEIKTIGGQVDNMPTLLYLMGVDENKYKDTVMGKNLLKTNRNFTVHADGSIVDKPSNPADKVTSAPPTQEQIDHARKGILKIADEVIRSNYFNLNKK